MSDDALVGLIIGSSLLIPAALIAWWLQLRFRRREIQHQEWMAALEKGVPLPALNRLEAGMGGTRTYLLHGLIWLACGVTLTVFLAGLWWTTGSQQSLESQLRQARELRELGYTENSIREIETQIRLRYPFSAARGPRFPLGLSLVGLVPAGVGVAYLVFYRLETRRTRQEK